MPIKFIASCLTQEQTQACKSLGIEIMRSYARSYGEITSGAVTDFSVHCFNSATLAALKSLGVTRATLHPELNLAQIRDMAKPIDTEVIIYGKLPLMKLGNPISDGYITDRKGIRFFVHKGIVYNSVPIFMADKLKEVEKAGVTHGRLIFTTESIEDMHDIIKAYKNRKALVDKEALIDKKMSDNTFTRGKFYSRV